MPHSPRTWMRARSAFAALVVGFLEAGCGPHLVHVDLDARSAPLADIPSGTSCPVAGPEIDLAQPELANGVLGWPANSLLQRQWEDGVLFPMHPHLAARVVVDPCDPDGFRPRVVFLLRGTSTRPGWGTRLFVDPPVLDSFPVTLPPGEVLSRGLPIPPGASHDRYRGRFGTVRIAQVGDEPLTTWAKRVTAGLQSLDPYESLYGDDERLRDSLMSKVVWNDAPGAGGRGSSRLLVLQVGAERTLACSREERCIYHIALDQQTRRFVSPPEVSP